MGGTLAEWFAALPQEGLLQLMGGSTVVYLLVVTTQRWCFSPHEIEYKGRRKQLTYPGPLSMYGGDGWVYVTFCLGLMAITLQSTFLTPPDLDSPDLQRLYCALVASHVIFGSLTGYTRVGADVPFVCGIWESHLHVASALTFFLSLVAHALMRTWIDTDYDLSATNDLDKMIIAFEIVILALHVSTFGFTMFHRRLFGKHFNRKRQLIMTRFSGLFQWTFLFVFGCHIAIYDVIGSGSRDSRMQVRQYRLPWVECGWDGQQR